MNINFLLLFSFFLQFRTTKYFYSQEDIDNENEASQNSTKKETLFTKTLQSLLKKDRTIVFQSNLLSDVYDFHCFGEIGLRISFVEIQNFVEKSIKKDIFTKSLESFQCNFENEININLFFISYYINFLSLIESEIFSLFYKFKGSKNIKVVRNEISLFFKHNSSDFKKFMIVFMNQNKIELENIFKNKKSKAIILELKKYYKLKKFILSNFIEICVDSFVSYLNLFKNIKTFYTECFGNDYLDFFIKNEKKNNLLMKNFDQILSKKNFEIKIFELEKLQNDCFEFEIILKRFDFLKTFLIVKILEIKMNEYPTSFSFISKNKISFPFFYTSEPENCFLKGTSKLFLKTLNLKKFRKQEIIHHIFIDPQNHLLYIFILRVFKTLRTADKFIILSEYSFTSKNLFLNDQTRNFLSQNKLCYCLENYIFTEILNFYQENSNCEFYLNIFIYKISNNAFIAIFNSVINDPELITFKKRSIFFLNDINFTKKYLLECLRFKISTILKNIDLINLISSEIEIINNHQ